MCTPAGRRRALSRRRVRRRFRRARPQGRPIAGKRDVSHATWYQSTQDRISHAARLPQVRKCRPERGSQTLRVQYLRGAQHSSCTYGVGGRKCNGRTGIEAALVCSTSLRVRETCCVSRESGVPYPRSFEGRGQGCTISGAVGTAGRPPTEYRR